MSNRALGACQVQPEWRKKILSSLPKNGDWAGVNLDKLIGNYVEDEDDTDGPDIDDYDAWYDDRAEWVAVALKELEFLGHIERRQITRGGVVEYRLTEAGANHLRGTVPSTKAKEAA